MGPLALYIIQLHRIMQTKDKTSWELPPVNNQTSQPQKAQEMQQSQNVLPGAQQAQTSIEIAPVSSEDCRDFLDLMFANLPSPVSTTVALPVAKQFPGSEGEVPASFPAPRPSPGVYTISKAAQKTIR